MVQPNLMKDIGCLRLSWLFCCSFFFCW